MLQNLINFIGNHDGINDKTRLAVLVKAEFNCTEDRSVFYTADFAIRFCKGDSDKFSNTVLSLSTLQKYDKKPFVVCVSAPHKNYLLLANTTFLAKISHSSKKLRVDNIKGSFNGSDILRNIGNIANSPQNFDVLFAIHQNYSFAENLTRLVEATNAIVPTGKRFDVSVGNNLQNILDSPNRAAAFAQSANYADLLHDLDERTAKFETEILVAALIENVNLRGRIIEYLIAGENADLREKLISYLLNNSETPPLVTKNDLGDYVKIYPNFSTKTDIKTKIMLLTSSPKGYNLDKMLQFLAEQNTVFMLYLVGIDYIRRNITTKLISMFQQTLVDNTLIQEHWAGRNSRGVSQFNGDAVKQIILRESNEIDVDKALRFLNKILLL
ncbi:MAG: hypothetical protein FWG64_03735 [Firmicutes bacterium]|nr:hypothetical protein [Bacillota bacterium]